MRILQVLPELEVGGVETGTVDFAKYLVAHGHHAVVVSHGGALVAELKKTGAKHYSLPVHKKSLWTFFKMIKALRRIILTEEIDIVHARSRVPGWISYFACRPRFPAFCGIRHRRDGRGARQGKKAEFITTCHGYYATHFFSRVMGYPKLVIVPSEVIGRHMIDNFHVSPENIRCIARSVDLSRFDGVKKETQDSSSGKGQDATCRISMVGRITPLKGHIYFLKAMAKVVRSNPFVRIWIIGDTPPEKESYRQELDVLVRRLGLTDHVEFLGTRRDIPQLLAQTDVLVLASIVPESFGRVILEAQAAGVAVVATKVGGVVEIIDDEKTGLLVFPKDTEAMSKAVVRLLNDRPFAKRLAVEAKKKLEMKFTVDHMASRTLEVYQELLGSLNILVIKISSMGDVILITPSLKALRHRYPKAKIHCLVGKESHKILQRCPYIDGIIVIDLKHSDEGLLGLVAFSGKLRAYKFDKVVDFQNNAKSHLLAWLSFSGESYGYNNGKMGFLLTHPVKNPDNNLQPVQHQFQVLKMLGIKFRQDALLELWPSANARKNVKRLLEGAWLSEGTNIVGIHLAASERWQTKNWPVEYVARLCDILAAQNIRVIITGMEKDKAAAENLLQLTATKPAIFVGKTDVMELSVLIKRCKVFITPDSAPMHLAAAVKTPFIALFGPTASARHLPPAKDCRVIERILDCAPCYSPQCRTAASAVHACMKDITPEDVAQEVNVLMAGGVAA